jgi:RNA polymerase-binding protein DksA
MIMNAQNQDRYSDAELLEFKEIILKKISKAQEQLEYCQNVLKEQAENGENKLKSLDDSALAMESENLSRMANRTAKYLSHLEKALFRIENKTYGICRETGQLISKQRLKAVPHATLSIEAKQGRT